MTRSAILVLLSIVTIMGAGCAMFSAPEESYKKGTEFVKEGKYEKAYKMFLSAIKKKPEEPKYHWAAAQTAKNQNAAFIHSEMAWKNGMKNVTVLLALMKLSLFTSEQQRIGKMVSLFDELNDTIKTPMLKAELFSQIGASDSAIAIWNNLYTVKPSAILAFKIGRELSVKNKTSEGKEFLEKAREQKILDAAGYVLLASFRAFDYDYKGVNEIFKETKRIGLYTNEVALEEAAFLFVSNNFDSAAAILDEYKLPVTNQPDQPVNLRARINLAFMYASRKQKDSINLLSQQIPSSSGFLKGEQQLYNLLVKADTSDTAYLMKELIAVRKQLPPNPFIDLFTARALLKSGRFNNAVELYRRLPGIYLRSPAILTEFAFALTRSGKDNDALVVLSVMHQKKVFTRGSLELFRDLTFKKNLIDKSEHAQQLLEKIYGDDVKLRWSGAIMAIKEGKIDSALTILNLLETKFPKENQFKLTRISALIIKGDYESALSICHSGSLPAEQTIPLEAQIYKKQGKEKEALNLIESALKENRKPNLLVEYAELLMEQNRNNDAVKVYEELLNNRQQDKKSNAESAALYNNMAWAMLHSQNPDKKLTIKTASKAYELLPNLPNIIDTYAEVLINFGEYSECIKLLESTPQTQKEPKFIYLLGTAYEKNRDANKAVRNFRAAVALMDSSSGTIKMDITKEVINSQIDKLMKGE
jgi:tetratricopeptide (TPR) repeat protein